jgi:branched-chain amino acid transport system substrate-binding protein
MWNTRGTSVRRAVRAIVALGAIAASSSLLGSCNDDTPTTPSEREVLLGGLFSLTGSWSTLGETSRAAMELGVEDVNQYLAGNPAHVRFAAAIEDTKLDPAVALAKAQALRARGVQLLIGPQSSAEVTSLKPWVDANGMLLVSQSSTAQSLTVAGDNVFRFTPSDSLEGVAVSALMWNDGIRAVVPVWRDDAGNTGVMTAGRTGFLTRGGAVLEGVSYAAATSDFRGTIASVKAKLQRAIAQYGEGKVAIHLAAFDEVVDLFAAAARDSLLRSVRWYGSDGVARSAALVANRQAAEFASRVGAGPATLYRWRRELRRTTTAKAPELTPAKLVEVRPLVGATDDRFEVRLSGGRSVGVPPSFDADALARLLRVLEAAR